MKKHYATHVEDTDKLISVAGPILEYKTWYEQYKKLMEEQAQRKYGLYTPTSEGGDDFDPSSFDQAWTVAGKTNEDSNRATIANITGNGNNLVLSNFGFAENSGYGLYAQNYMKWTQVHDRGDFTATSGKVNITSVKNNTATLIYKNIEHLKQRIRVTGLPEGVNLIIGRALFDFYVIPKDGIYDVDVIDSSGQDPVTIGYKISKVLESCDITIEQIPEYEGYLITDGVDDKVVSSDFVMDKEFTIVGEWKLVSDEMGSAGIVKPSSLFVFNKDNGLIIYINNTSKGQVLNTKSLKAICSDGRVYYDDWSEMLVSEEQPIASSNKYLMIGSNGNHFTKIALKNLAIYNHILSKDDCIKAYDYLQTLKAK